jgi:DNA polymerase-3 subunit epsilon
MGLPMSLFHTLRRAIDRVGLRDRHYKFLFGPDTSGEVVSVDCETTGFDPWIDDIISIAAIKIRGNQILTSETFQAVIKPDASMRAEAIKVHQLRSVDVENGRPMSEVLPEFLHFLGGRPIVGYWIDFDCRMLSKYLLGMLGISLPNPRIEVSALYYDRKYKNAPPNTKIDLRFAAIIEDLGLRELHQHDAFSDALSAAEMYVILKDMEARGALLRRNRTEMLAEGLAAG